MILCGSPRLLQDGGPSENGEENGDIGLRPRGIFLGQNHFDLVRITFGTCGSRKGLPYWAGLSIRSTTDISPQLRRLLLPSRSMKFTSFLLFLPLTSGLKE